MAGTFSVIDYIPKMATKQALTSATQDLLLHERLCWHDSRVWYNTGSLGGRAVPILDGSRIR